MASVKAMMKIDDLYKIMNHVHQKRVAQKKGPDQAVCLRIMVRTCCSNTVLTLRIRTSRLGQIVSTLIRRRRTLSREHECRGLSGFSRFDYRYLRSFFLLARFRSGRYHENCRIYPKHWDTLTPYHVCPKI